MKLRCSLAFTGKWVRTPQISGLWEAFDGKCRFERVSSDASVDRASAIRMLFNVRQSVSAGSAFIKGKLVKDV